MLYHIKIYFLNNIYFIYLSNSAISRPRFRSVGNKPLPSPRLVSIVVHADVSHLHSRYTLMLMQVLTLIRDCEPSFNLRLNLYYYN